MRSVTVSRHCDVTVIGGSAAGLAAALQLSRQRRGVVVVDDGTPRNAPAAHMHGYLGHEGAAPGALTGVGRAEVRSMAGRCSPAGSWLCTAATTAGSGST
ncbi:FAD-binding protein [Streptomyces ardesiacus]